MIQHSLINCRSFPPFSFFFLLHLLARTHRFDEMKLQTSEIIPLSKPKTQRKTRTVISIVALTFILTIIPLYFPYSQNYNQLSLSFQIGFQSLDHNTIRSKTTPPQPKNPNLRDQRAEDSPNNIPPDAAAATSANSTSSNEKRGDEEGKRTSDAVVKEKKCDLFSGEWAPNPDGPYYTNTTCYSIQDHQNCMRFGRLDLGFMKWRWKPDECELPLFDPIGFLELVRGKSLAFVGDSVARNHMQSLICLLSTVGHPVDMSKPKAGNRLYVYTEYNFNISIISSPYLIRTEKTVPGDFATPFNLFLDEFDQTWTGKIQTFDYIIISAGQWFFRPSYFYLNRTLIGCLYCPESNVTHLPSAFSYRWAFRTAFRAINGGAGKFNGVAFLRTLAPSHFEGGPWDRGGDCVRTGPYKRNETALEEYNLEMYSVQLEEMRTAQKAGRGTGGKVRLFDATNMMVLRPDGHPSKYGHWPVANRTIPNDCVHWCLPGPIDAWNDLLQELLKREVKKQSKIT